MALRPCNIGMNNCDMDQTMPRHKFVALSAQQMAKLYSSFSEYSVEFFSQLCYSNCERRGFA